MAKRPPVETVDYSMDFFVKDFLVATLSMTGPERAAYALSLVLGWTQHATFPADPERFRRLMNYDPDEWTRVWPSLEPKWPTTGDRRVNRRQLKEWTIASDRLAVYRVRAASGVAARRQLGLLPPESSSTPDSTTGSTTSTTPSPSPSPSPSYPSLTGNGVPNSEEVRASSASRPTVAESFDIFWTAYPRKAEKKKTREEFAKLKPDDRAKALATVGVFAVAWKDVPEEREHFIPHPHRWLAHHRFDDDPKDWKRQATAGNGKRPAMQEPERKRIRSLAEMDQKETR